MRIINKTPFRIMTQSTQVPPPARSLTIIVKGTFDLVPDGVCLTAKEQQNLSPDQPHLDDIGRSLAWAGDFAPFKPHTDFYVFGAFHQPGGIPAREGVGGFSFGPFNKTLRFTGPRAALCSNDGAWTVAAPVSMTTVPLRWEYSYGGLDDPRNPMGCGLDAEQRPDGATIVRLPQIESVDQPLLNRGDRPAPANFTAVPPGFAERLKKRGTYDRRWSVFRAPLPPTDFDPSIHNAAPQDQQAGNYPAGDETLVLRNLHPTHPELRTGLPGLRLRVGLLRKTGDTLAAEEVQMRLDTVVPMPDLDRLVLVWRGVTTVQTAAARSEVTWLHAETEPLAQAPQPFEALADAMLRQHREENPSEEAAVAQVVAEGLAEARQRLSKIPNLPANLQKIVNEETDPQVIYEALCEYLETTLTELETSLSR